MPVSEVKERPILMSAPMVVACMRDVDPKGQTRRIMKIQPEEGGYVYQNGDNWNVCLAPDHYKDIQGIAWQVKGVHHVSHVLKCPYGKVGDRLWVRENYRFEKFFEIWGIDDWAATVYYPADNASRQIYQCDAPEDVGFWPGAAIRRYEGKNRPCIFMYRWVSRITLEITEVRVERLQDISDEDCIAEGIGYVPQLGIMRACGWQDYSGKTVGFLSPRDSYRSLWESINGSGSWDLNPWVFVIDFCRL